MLNATQEAARERDIERMSDVGITIDEPDAHRFHKWASNQSIQIIELHASTLKALFAHWQYLFKNA